METVAQTAFPMAAFSSDRILIHPNTVRNSSFLRNQGRESYVQSPQL